MIIKLPFETEIQHQIGGLDSLDCNFHPMVMKILFQGREAKRVYKAFQNCKKNKTSLTFEYQSESHLLFATTSAIRWLGTDLLVIINVNMNEYADSLVEAIEPLD